MRQGLLSVQAKVSLQNGGAFLDWVAEIKRSGAVDNRLNNADCFASSVFMVADVRISNTRFRFCRNA